MAAFQQGMALGQSAVNAALDVKMQKMRDERIRQELGMRQRVIDQKMADEALAWKDLAEFGKLAEANPTATASQMSEWLPKFPNIFKSQDAVNALQSSIKVASGREASVMEETAKAANAKLLQDHILDVAAYGEETGIVLTPDEARKDKGYTAWRQQKIAIKKAEEAFKNRLAIADVQVKSLLSVVSNETAPLAARQKAQADIDAIILDLKNSLGGGGSGLEGMTKESLGGGGDGGGAETPDTQTPQSPAAAVPVGNSGVTFGDLVGEVGLGKVLKEGAGSILSFPGSQKSKDFFAAPGKLMDKVWFGNQNESK